MTTDRAAVGTRIIPYIFYRDVVAALDFLGKAFGFVEVMRTGTESGGIHAEMALDGQTIMMGQGGTDARLKSPAEAGTSSQGIFVWIADVNAHFRKAEAAGAAIEHPPQDLSYGRGYTARDSEGHPWYFTRPPADRG